MKVSADAIKASVASYFRYVRQFPLVALEANYNLGHYKNVLADMLVVSPERVLYEIEVKVSLSDLRRDIKMKRKHWHFRNQSEYTQLVTRYFYFAVPRDIANKCCLICDELYPYAGVIGTDGRGQGDVDFYRKAKVLNMGKRLSSKHIHMMVREQSATIARLATKVAELQNNRR